jgi:cytoskeletal protein RodZ
LAQTGGAGATLYYTVNGGTPIAYTAPFVINKATDTLSIDAVFLSSHEFVRWYDSLGNVISLTETSGIIDLSIYGSAVTFTAVFSLYGDKITVDMDSDPTGASLWYTITTSIGTLKETAYTTPFPMDRNETLTVRAGNLANHTFERWEDSSGPIGSTPVISGIAMPSSGTTETFTAYYTLAVPTPKDYVITSTADSNSTVSPKGTVTVSGGSSITFTFSAAQGHAVSSVEVDGRALSQAQIASGSYTFYDVHANHTIKVTSRDARSDITLRINVIEGSGYAEYRINNGSFVRYDRVVTIQEFSDLEVRAFGLNGSEFVKWVDGARTYTESSISFPALGGSISLDLYFTEDSGTDIPWLMVVIAAIAVIAAAGVIWWFFFVFRRAYEVIKVSSSSSIIGKDKARRKSKYVFSVEEGASGTVSYRVGEDGMWKSPLSTPEGEYVIPKGEITDSVTIELR